MCCITCTVLIMYIQDDRLLTKTHPFPGFCLDFLKTFLNIAFERYISALGLAIFRFKLRHLVREIWWCLLTKHISISFSVLRKDFETPPYSAHIEVGSQAELRCHPPRGHPDPRVVAWLRNGVPIQTDKEKNFIISSTGRFIYNMLITLGIWNMIMYKN